MRDETRRSAHVVVGGRRPEDFLGLLLDGPRVRLGARAQILSDADPAVGAGPRVLLVVAGVATVAVAQPVLAGSARGAEKAPQRLLAGWRLGLALALRTGLGAGQRQLLELGGHDGRRLVVADAWRLAQLVLGDLLAHSAHHRLEQAHSVQIRRAGLRPAARLFGRHIVVVVVVVVVALNSLGRHSSETSEGCSKIRGL